MFEPLLESVSAVATSTESKTTPKNILVSTSTSATCETEFYDYLQNRTKRYAVDNGYISCSLLNEDKETIVATATELYGDSNFIKLNEQQHNRFSAAINKLLEFIGAKVPEKAVVSTGYIRRKISDMAAAEYNAGGSDKVVDIIEGMGDAELKKWLTDVVRRDIDLGVKIIINREV